MMLLPLVPRPVSICLHEGSFKLPAIVTIWRDQAFAAEADVLVEMLARLLPVPPRLVHDASLASIKLQVRREVDHPEGYTLSVVPDGILICARTPAGVFHGCQTFLQLIHNAKAATAVEGIAELPSLMIEDRPRFRWRGLMLDVSRHFFTADQVCRLLDLMALYKLNVFHWHLTDDQGWRFPVKRYPRLTEVGSVRPYTLIGHLDERPRRYDSEPHAGFNTTEDIQRVVTHAARRHITVVPEIDMPGHMQAAIAAYPELGNLNAKIGVRCHWGISQHILHPRAATVEFMQHVLEEVMDLFPGQFIHVGGDEANKFEWSESREVQDRMAELGLHSEAELQAWFIGQMNQFVTAHGRRLIGWDEILEGGLVSGAAVMSWRGMDGGIQAASAGHDVVMAPHTHTYLDMYQAGPEGEPLAIGGMTTLEKSYTFDPVPPQLDPAHHHHIMGGQAQLWTEYIPSMSHLQYMAFPRLCALAETFWSRAEDRDWNGFQSRLQESLKMLTAMGVQLKAAN